MTTWLEYVTILRDSVISYDPTTLSSDSLEDLTHWAFNDLCQHTAAITELLITTGVTINPDDAEVYDLSVDLQYTLDPLPYFYPFEAYETAAVYVDDAIIAQTTYSFTRNGYILFDAAPGGTTLEVVYYSYYPLPEVDTDVIAIPQWAEGIVAHRIVSYATQRQMVQAAFIGQFDGNRDAGNPEHNPLKELQTHSEIMYKHYLSYIPRQDRALGLW